MGAAGAEAWTPLGAILRSRHVTDIISLNADLTVERLLRERPAGPLPRADLREPAAAGSPAGRPFLSRCRTFQVPAGALPAATRRVWHPHGDRSLRDSLVFGLWRYEQALRALSEARGHFKRDERQHGYDALACRIRDEPRNWLELIISRPLLFLGTSFDAAEWDLWYALISRWRNYRKAD